ncbi:MAG: hypothetical protein AAF483_09555, partial [Planctomycetota bacterium]
MNQTAGAQQRLTVQMQSIDPEAYSAIEDWLQVCCRIADFKNHTQNDHSQDDSWLEPVIEAAESLPLELRQCPDAWFEDLIHGHRQDLLALACCLSEDQLLRLSDHGNIARLLRSPNLRFLRVLDLRFDFDFDTQIDESICNEDLFTLAKIENYHPEVIKLSRGIDHDGIAALVHSPIMAQCRSLELADANARVDRVIEALVSSQFAGKLESLNLNWTSFSEKPGYPLHLTDESLAKLMRSKLGKQLRELRLQGYSLTETGVREISHATESLSIQKLDLSHIGGREAGSQPIILLANSKNIRPLRELIYCDTQVDDEAAEAIAKSSVLSKEMEVLDLSFSRALTARGALALANSPWLRNLRRLNLSAMQGIEDEGVVALAGSSWFSNLEELDLSCVAMTDKGLEAILNSGIRPKSLSVSINRIEEPIRLLTEASECLSEVRFLKINLASAETGEYFNRFANLASLSKLKRLSISRSRSKLVGEFVVEIANSSTIKGLVELTLGGCELNSAEPAIAIAESASLGHLQVLEMGSCRIGNAGAMALAGSLKLRKLRQLSLDRNLLTDQSIQAFAESELTPNLRELILHQNDFSMAANQIIEDSCLQRIPRFTVQQITYICQEVQHMAIRRTR